MPTLLCEERLCTALTSCLIFLTSTIMHFGLRASLQTRPLCELLEDITKCQTDVLCGCNTQMILQLSALEPLKSHFCLESFSVSILHTDCMQRPCTMCTCQHTWCWLNCIVPLLGQAYHRHLSFSSAVMHCSGSMYCCLYIDA